MDNLFEVDPRKCKHSGLCATVCPLRLITIDERTGLPARIEGSEKQCIYCNRCVTACPEQAIFLRLTKRDEEEARANHLFVLDAQKCRRDYACVAVCPFKLITVHSTDKLPYPIDRAELQCTTCGHCVAVCPHDALSLKVLKPGPLTMAEDGILTFAPLSLQTMKPEECNPVNRKLLPSAEEMKHFIASRRSVRTYQDRPVIREILADIIDSARYAPTAFNSQPVHWLVIKNAGEVKRLAGLVVEWMRHVLREDSVLAESLNMKRLVVAWEKGEDRICRGAPHLIVAHADGRQTGVSASCTIALTYLELAAFSQGLGACWAGYFTRAANLHPPLLQALNLPKDHQVFGTLMVGYPRYRYHRIPSRKEAGISWR